MKSTNLRDVIALTTASQRLASVPDQSLAMALVAFLRDQRYPHVIADYPNDLRLFRQVISWYRPRAGCRLEELPSFPCTLWKGIASPFPI